MAKTKVTKKATKKTNLPQRRSIRVFCAESGRQTVNSTTTAPARRRTKQVSRKSLASSQPSKKPSSAATKKQKTTATTSKVTQVTHSSVSRKNVSGREERKGEEKGATEEIRNIWRPKVRALKEQNTKLLKRVERVEEL